MLNSRPQYRLLPLIVALLGLLFTTAVHAGDGFKIDLLSARDIELYREIFELQDDGKWDQADKLIAQLSDPVLMGHVEFQRYMHPTAYRSKFSELSAWMSAYADLPGASRIYRLAKKRQGGARSPTQPVPIVGGDGSGTKPPTPARAADRRSKDDRSALARFRSRFDREIYRNNPERAEKRLYAFEAREIFTPEEFADALTDVAENYFYNGNDEKAFALASLAVETLATLQTQANWIAGLAAWRSGDCQGAMKHFSVLALDPDTYPMLKAAGAFWAARAHIACQDPDDVAPLLRIAAKEKYTFYGLLAMRQLGLQPDFKWDHLPLSYEDYLELSQLDGVKRAIALAEIGKYDLADEELRLVWNRRQYDDPKNIIALAARLDLPASQILLAEGSADQNGLPDSAFFPVPKWQPESGFKVDRALMFGFMRQESHFLPRAHSGAGAYGLMQLMPATASFISGDRSLRWSGKYKLLIPEINMEISQTYMMRLFADQVTDGNLLKFATAYNGGPGNLGRWDARIDYKGDPLLFIETIPYRETRNFIEKVLANMWIYRIRFGQPTPSLDATAAGAWPFYEQLDGEFGQAFEETVAAAPAGGS